MKPGIFFAIFFLFILGNRTIAQQKDPWTNDQLMPPAALAEKITHHQTNDLLILSIGPGALIKGSVDIGPAHESTHFQKLKDYLKKVNRDKTIVIYCGCCPFDKCPNVRPAFTMLTEMGFKNIQLLNLSRNIKADWLDQHYPVAE